MPQEFDATTTDSAAPPLRGSGPLHGIRVLDISTGYAAPISAMLLGDFGAEVIKIEHPVGDPARSHGANKNGHGLWWKVISRNKRCVTLNLGRPEGQRILRELVTDADVGAPGLPYHVLLRAILDCVTVTEALNVLQAGIR